MGKMCSLKLELMVSDYNVRQELLIILNYGALHSPFVILESLNKTLIKGAEIAIIGLKCHNQAFF